MLIHTRIDKRQVAVAELIKHAADLNAIDYAALSDGEIDRMLTLADGAATQLLEKRELLELTMLVQQSVKLTDYTTKQAAAWLGMSTDGVSDAVRKGILAAHKPGHDLRYSHKELERYAQERKYALT